MNTPYARWLLDEMDKLWDTHPERVARVLENALESDPELKWAVVIGGYLQEQINLGKAAELLGMDRWTLQEEFLRQGIPIRIGAQTIDELRAEVQAMEEWKAETS